MIEQLLKQLSEEGILGVLLVICLFAIAVLYKENKTVRDGRLADLKEIWAGDVKFREELKVLVNSILAILKDNK